MRNFLLAALLFSTTSAFSSTFAPLKTFSNENLQKSWFNIGSLETITHADTKKVVVLKADANTPAGIRKNTMAQAMHTLCVFFDEGVTIDLKSKNDAGSLAATKEFTEDFLHDGTLDFDTILRYVKLANSEESVEVYSGTAGGNNTYGSVLGFFDVKNNEIAVFANTNCGSDN